MVIRVMRGFIVRRVIRVFTVIRFIGLLGLIGLLGHTYTYIHAQTHTQTHTNTHTYTHTHIHTYTHTHIHTYTHTHIHTYTHTHIHTHIYTYTHAHIHTRYLRRVGSKVESFFINCNLCIHSLDKKSRKNTHTQLITIDCTDMQKRKMFLCGLQEFSIVFPSLYRLQEFYCLPWVYMNSIASPGS
jgi:hypothetical protein